MDDELCIPIVKGIFITFNGRKPHHTVIANGSVDLLGPFDVHDVKCVAAVRDLASTSNEGKHTGKTNVFLYATYPSTGPVTGVNGKRRLLNEEGGTENRTISGNAFRGVVVEPDNRLKIIGHKIAHNVTGLPQCSSCKMSIGLSAAAQECTAEAHKDASIIPLLVDVNYTSDDQGNTGVKSIDFIPDIEHPTGKQFLALALAEAEAEALAPFQNSSVSIFYYDNEGELIGCSFLQRIISEEDKVMAAVILALTTAEHDHVNLDTLAAVDDGGNNAGSTSLVSYLAIGMHAVCIMLLNLYG